MYKTVWDLSADQFAELKSNFFWGDDTPEELKNNNIGLPALFPGDIPDNVIAEYYSDISFVDDDFCSAPGDPWTDSRMGFYEIYRKDGTYCYCQWLTGAKAKEYEKAGYIVRRYK